MTTRKRRAERVPPSASWTITTPATAPGAVAIVQLTGDIEAAMRDWGWCIVPVGGIALRDLFGIDRGLVVRWTTETLQLMPHGGPRILRKLAQALLEAGIPESPHPAPRALYPEATTEIEARMLATLARAASPLAIDLLLAQPRRWAQPGAASDPARDRILNRLIDPPLIAALGGANIGKSTLANALAGRAVSVVADEPGTTRDHVGITLDLAGLVVRYIDTPGVRETDDSIEREAQAASLAAAAGADLILLCGDHTAPPPELPPALRSIPALRLALRADLGRPAFAHDAALGGLHAGSLGIDALADLIRERLVPCEVLAAPDPWTFWQAQPPSVLLRIADR